MPDTPVIARAALHHWEEPCISGTRGSGTVFFSGCTLGCVFCQNRSISHEHFGKSVTVSRLRELFDDLVRQGAHNINFVNPTHYGHTIRALLESRPLPERDFEFLFYLDLDIPAASPVLGELIALLESEAEELRYLGSYSEVV